MAVHVVLMLNTGAHTVSTCIVYSSLFHARCGPLPHSLASSPGSNVIILSAPAPVLVREAIHLHVLVWGHCRNPTKILWVRQPGRVTSPMYNLENNVSAQYIYIEVHPRTHACTQHTHCASTCI